jgi:hypothetical protein
MPRSGYISLMRYDKVMSPADPCAIIISTGRCGSTLLSTLIAEEPETLSVSESLGPLVSHLARLPATRDITGAEYWSLLSEPHTRRQETARIWSVFREFGPGDGIPPIMLVTLPGISADPGRLFATLAGRVPHFPPRPLAVQHKTLLDLLAALAGKRRWVERSGASSSVAEPLLRAMPDARFVYLSRNVADTARSMSKHIAFRFALARFEFHQRYGADPYNPEEAAAVPDAASLPPELRRLLPGQVTAEALHDLGRDRTRFEAMCATMMDLAEQALAAAPPRHLHRIRYEDLVASPLAELTALGGFLGFANPAAWAAATAHQVRPSRPRPVQAR